MKVSQDTALMRLVIRKDHTLCTNCYLMEPVYVGDGTGARAFIQGLQMMADRHRNCDPNDPETLEARKAL